MRTFLAAITILILYKIGYLNYSDIPTPIKILLIMGIILCTLQDGYEIERKTK